MTIAVIGAGIAGLACAGRLADAGREVVVLEKSRGLGGRLATRRTDGGQFDHGAQYVTARGEAFADYLTRAEQAGHAAPWASLSAARWAGQPGMSGLVRPLAAGLDIRQPVRVAGVTRAATGWTLGLDDGSDLEADTVLIAIPHDQAMELAGSWLDDVPGIRDVELAPCWTVMLDAGEALPVDFTAGADLDEVLGWVALDSSKPGREAPHHWAIQASPAWSRAHLEKPADWVTDQLVARFAAHFGIAMPAGARATAHRWRYARVVQPLGQACIWKPGIGLGAAGDWCLDARVEAAFDSGQALAEAVLAEV